MPMPPPFFQIPFPDPPVLYYDLPQGVRDAWVAYARANRLSWQDYRREIRQTDDAYLMLNQTELLRTNGATGLYYPPGNPATDRRPIDSRLISVSSADHIAFRLARPLTYDLDVALWATETDADPANIDPRNNLFLGTVSLPRGSTQNTTSTDIGPAYVAAFATLAGLDGDSVALWAFTLAEGQLTYLAGFSAVVVPLCFLDCELYWPLNEATGTRRSIAQPMDLTPNAAPGQTTGPIDDAASFGGGADQRLQSADTAVSSPNGNTFTLALWFNLTSTASDRVLVRKGAHWSTDDMEFFLIFSTGNKSVFLNWTNGAGAFSQHTGNNTVTATATWIHYVLTYDPAVPQIKMYLDGTESLSVGATFAPPQSEAPWTVAGSDGLIATLDGAISEVCAWTRKLSADEVTALYNAGAGLRYPFQ